MEYIRVIVSYRWVKLVPSVFRPKGEPSFVAASMFQYWIVKSSDARYTPLSKLVDQATIAHAVLSHATEHGIPAMSVRSLDAQPTPKPKRVSENQLRLFGGDDDEQ